MTDPVVRNHLRNVATRLRAETSPDLPEPTRTRRLRLLDRLTDYADAGVFPRRVAPERARRVAPPRAFDVPDLAKRSPRFRDEEGTWCAVGCLLARERPDLAERIARDENDAYVPEMQTPGLHAWAREAGLSPDDLA